MSDLESTVGFMPYPAATVEHAKEGPLLGLSFGVKDLFDVAGYPTSAGQPLWLVQSGIKTTTAPAVTRLLEAGAAFAGKTITDEFAFSIAGDNAHFGSPLNPAAPQRLAGGSSSGSAAVVAHGRVDFSLGTDTAGSVRAPASNCGIFGFRPTHDRVSLEGVHALAPSFDACGWFAQDLSIMARVSEVLLGLELPESSVQPQLLKPVDLYSLVSSEITEALAPSEARLGDLFGGVETCRVVMGSPDEMINCFRTIQGYEAWKLHGSWIMQHRPTLGPGIKERFEWASNVGAEDYQLAKKFRERFTESIRALLHDAGVLVLPTVGDVAPLRTASAMDLESYRQRALALLCTAGLAGLPQLSLPLASYQGAPVGISLVGPAGSDRLLLSMAERLMSEMVLPPFSTAVRSRTFTQPWPPEARAFPEDVTTQALIERQSVTQAKPSNGQQKL